MALAETSHSILKQKRDGSSITGQQSVCKFHLGLYFPYHIGGVCAWAERLIPRTLDLEVGGWKPPPTRCFLIDKELYSTLSLFTQVYKCVPVTYFCGVTLRWTNILSKEK